MEPRVASLSIDLTVQQVQADLPFENLFLLPVDIEILSAEGTRTHTVELDDWITRVSLPAKSRPRSVIFDKGNWLVAEIEIARPLEGGQRVLGRVRRRAAMRDHAEAARSALSIRGCRHAVRQPVG